MAGHDPLRNSEKLACEALADKLDEFLRPSDAIPERAISFRQTKEYPPSDPIITYIYEEMDNNSTEENEDFRKIKRFLARALRSVGSFLDAGILFAEKVGSCRPWDHKKAIFEEWGVASSLDGQPIQYDVWSNIHYGYVGALAGFSPFILLQMAGAVQGAVPPGYWGRIGEYGWLGARDDPRDQEAIKIGLELKAKYGKSLSRGQFSNYLRRNVHRISGKIEPREGVDCKDYNARRPNRSMPSHSERATRAVSPELNMQRLRKMLIKHEGLRLKVYDDATGKTIRPGTRVKGIPTIGVGRNLVDRGIENQEAHYLLDNDLARTMAELGQAFPWSTDLNAVRTEVLANMLFNLGLTRLRGFRNMLSAAKAGDYALAATEMLNSKWARQVGKRAEELATAMRTGSFSR